MWVRVPLPALLTLQRVRPLQPGSLPSPLAQVVGQAAEPRLQVPGGPHLGVAAKDGLRLVAHQLHGHGPGDPGLFQVPRCRPAQVVEPVPGEAGTPTRGARDEVGRNRHGAYNKTNFARYFTESDLILTRGARNSPAKKYRLSREGERRAVTILRDLVGDE